MCAEIKIKIKITINKGSVFLPNCVFGRGGGGFCCLPSVVPSSPMMIFIEVMICWATGGDMEVAYRAL